MPQTPWENWTCTALDWPVPSLVSTEKPPTPCDWLCPSSTHVYPGTSPNRLLASQPPSPWWGACGTGSPLFPIHKIWLFTQSTWPGSCLAAKLHISGKAQLSHVVLGHFLYKSLGSSIWIPTLGSPVPQQTPSLFAVSSGTPQD